MRDQQIAWGELVLGADTPYWWESLTGWEDLPGVDAGDVARPSRHGAWGGRALAGVRTVAYTCQIPGAPDEVQHYLEELIRATPLAEDAATRPLTVRTLGQELTAWAQVRSRVVTRDDYLDTGMVSATVQWVCPDPRRYWATPSEVVVPAGGERPAPQSGGAATHPTVRIHGPCDSPVLRLHGDPDLVLSWDLALAADEWLEIDTHAGTAVDGTGAARTGDLTASSVPLEAWTVPPGAPRVSLEVTTSSDPARAWISYRHAYL